MQPSRDKVRFVLGSTPLEISLEDPGLTLLDYLRNQACLTGTKEGCAEGDCGACTVLIAELYDNSLKYTAANACILLLGMVDGKQVLTVEHLASDTLHPAQQAMIDHHGSQCGFCTPGFIMSMANLYQNACINEKQALTDQEIHAALSGNLCRCTGYRPIIDAAKKMAELPKVDVAEISARAGVQTFDPDTATNSPEPLQYKDGRRLFMPYTEEQLKALLKAYPHARLWAGGTDIGLEVTQRFAQFDTIICVNRIPELAACTRGQDMGDPLWLGACVTFSQAETELAEPFPSFAQLLHRIGSRQIRNMGTLGGNIANASPIGDTPPVFLALAATLEIDGINGRREVPVKDFYLGYKQTVMQPGEYLRGIKLSQLSAEETLITYKISKRYDDDISAVMFALYLKITDGVIETARLACGGMAATPLIGGKTSAALSGKPFTLDTFTQAAECIGEDYQPISDVRASDTYRIQVTKNLLTKAFIEMNQKGDAA